MFMTRHIRPSQKQNLEETFVHHEIVTEVDAGVPNAMWTCSGNFEGCRARPHGRCCNRTPSTPNQAFIFICLFLFTDTPPHATRHTPHATIFCWQDCGKLRVQITGVMNLGTNPKGKTTAKTMEWTCQGVFSNHEGHNLLVFIISSTSCRMSSTKSRQRYKMRVLLRA